MSGLCTFSSSWPFFTLSSSRALMSTTRPLASEMTGHFAGDVGKDRAGDVQLSVRHSTLLGRDQRELLRLVDRDQAHVAGRDDLRARRRAVGRMNFFSQPVRASACGQTCGGASECICSSLDHLASHSKIQLAGGG